MLINISKFYIRPTPIAFGSSTPTSETLKSQLSDSVASPSHTMAAGDRSLIVLPRDNLEGILTELPLPSLLACCAASKSLLKLIKEDSEFARLHLAKSEPQLMIQSSCIRLIDLDTDAASWVDVKPNFNTPSDGFQIIHSCNGLVLLEHIGELDNVHRCMIYNPVTGEFSLLPELVARYRTISGFFYCPQTNQFEVLSTFYREIPLSDSDSEMELYQSSGSDTDMEPYPVSDHDTNSEGSDLDIGSEDQELYSDSESDYVYSESDAVGEIYIKGAPSWESLGILPFSPLTISSKCHLEKAVHWICSDKAVPNLIVLYNFETHEFDEISGPAHLVKNDALAYTDLVMVVIGNRLSIIDRFTCWLKFSVWVMKEYGVKDSWSREFVVDTTGWLVHARRCLIPSYAETMGK
ncbi:F-box protein At3g07870-like [Bidens hawaiensis]|uniref:F-box protein At3g07870-like n=1 Tax=Bidens hawaiensis TaxID=980011 RepID=UPI00404B06F2